MCAGGVGGEQAVAAEGRAAEAPGAVQFSARAPGAPGMALG